MGDITKLPKWAQQELNKANNAAIYWKGQYLSITGEKETSIKIHGNLGLENADSYLPSGSNISFKLKKDDRATRAIDISIVQETLRIYGDDMVVLPRSSNSIYIKQFRIDL